MSLMKKRHTHSGACALSLLTLGALTLTARPAAAQVTMYTSQSGYNASSFSIATIAFDGLLSNQNSFVGYGNPGSLSVAGVTFTTSTGTDLYVVGPGYVDGGGHSFNFPGDGTATLDPEHGTTSVLTATLPANVSAVGTQIGGFYSPAALTITINGTSTFTYTAPAGHTGLGYLGFVATTGTINSISFSDPTPDVSNAAMVFDNFTYGTVNPAPEPSTAVGLALGTLGLAVTRFRAQRRPRA
jgi:hypothetical protein